MDSTLRRWSAWSTPAPYEPAFPLSWLASPGSTVSEDVHIGGRRVRAVPAQVSLRLDSANERFDWDATVWFCDPWPFPFQLLGMEGFLQRFRVTLSAYHEWLDCHPET